VKFSDQDINQIRGNGLSLEEVLQQLNIYNQGFDYANLLRPCTVGDGIRLIKESEFPQLLTKYNQEEKKGRTMKFIPASGAASRMFRLLQSALKTKKSIQVSQIKKKAASGSEFHKDLLKFCQKIKDFAFYSDLQKALSGDGIDIEEQIRKGEFKEIVEAVISTSGLNYAELPKGLIKFHKYPGEIRTAFEEHFVEAMGYSKDAEGNISIHFTVSPEHEKMVSGLFQKLSAKYRGNGLNYEISYSFQKPQTQSLAVDIKNNPFRLQDGRLLFRPGGHGALLENMNELEGDIVFIKNVDNVVPDRLKEPTLKYKKLLGGLLIEIQEKMFKYVRALNRNSTESIDLEEIAEFARESLSIQITDRVNQVGSSELKNLLFDKLNRPLRVCGMVKNEGEPGGGPFWVIQKNGEASIQVVETSQIDQKSPQQKSILDSATHFSPTDFVCGVRDFQGKPFNLMQYRDPDTGFIAHKSQEGKELKSYELPGLWNGSMAFWNTIFVEVPIITFNPVKTILDLLRPQHQAED